MTNLQNKEDNIVYDLELEESENIVLKEISSSNDDKELYVNAHGVTKRRKRRRFKHKKKWQKVITIMNRILFCLIGLILIVGLIGFIVLNVMKSKGKSELLATHENANISSIEEAEALDNGHTVKYNGKTYVYNENLISIVILGIDQSELGTDINGEAGQADAVYIFTYDTESGKCSFVTVSRETMTDIKLYSTEGTPMGFQKAQLCLAYAYGDGKQLSCTNTLDALSKIFYNIPFANYVSLNWDCIGPLTDAIGGVNVKVLEDITTRDNGSFTKGDKVTLTGHDAWLYVKYRNTKYLESNPARLSRQKQFMNAYITKLLPAARNDLSIVTDLYDIASDYMVTNISENQVVYIASEILPNVYSTKDINFYNIDGEILQGDIYAEFYPDETSLYETILTVFYTQVQE